MHLNSFPTSTMNTGVELLATKSQNLHTIHQQQRIEYHQNSPCESPDVQRSTKIASRAAASEHYPDASSSLFSPFTRAAHSFWRLLLIPQSEVDIQKNTISWKKKRMLGSSSNLVLCFRCCYDLKFTRKVRQKFLMRR